MAVARGEVDQEKVAGWILSMLVEQAWSVDHLEDGNVAVTFMMPADGWEMLIAWGADREDLEDGRDDEDGGDREGFDGRESGKIIAAVPIRDVRDDIASEAAFAITAAVATGLVDRLPLPFVEPLPPTLAGPVGGLMLNDVVRRSRGVLALMEPDSSAISREEAAFAQLYSAFVASGVS